MSETKPRYTPVAAKVMPDLTGEWGIFDREAQQTYGLSPALWADHAEAQHDCDRLNAGVVRVDEVLRERLEALGAQTTLDLPNRAHERKYTARYGPSRWTLTDRSRFPRDSDRGWESVPDSRAHCSFCGSITPEVAVEIMRAGGTREWADRKYGWPHKIYLDEAVEPFERSTGWDYDAERQKVYRYTTATSRHRKFYSEHLLDASPETLAEFNRLNGRFVFEVENGRLMWRTASREPVPSPAGGAVSAPGRPDLNELEALLRAGTPGPWHAGYASARCKLDHDQGRGGHRMGDCRYTFDGWRGEEASVSRARDWQPDDVVDGGADDLVAGTWDYDEGGVRHREDVVVIVALRNAAPALIAYARALDAQNEAYRDRQARYEDALAARTLAIPAVRQQERERCAGLLIAESGRRFAKGDDDMGEHLEYLASAIRALPDQEGSDA